MNNADPMTLASSLRRWLRIRDGETLLEYGAGNGALVGALRRMGIQAFGCSDTMELGDVDPLGAQWLSEAIPDRSYAYVIALHFPLSQDVVLRELCPRFWTSLLIGSPSEVSPDDLVKSMKRMEKIDPRMVVSACLNPPFASGKGELYLTCRKLQ